MEYPFAVGDWVQAKETEEQRKEEFNKPLPSWEELVEKIQNNENVKKEIEKWQPCEFNPNQFPQKLDSEYIATVDRNEPEYAFISFIEAWKSNNFGHIAKSLLYVKKSEINKEAGILREELFEKNPKEVYITNIKDESPAMSEITFNLTYQNGDELKQVNDLKMRFLYRDSNYHPCVRGIKGGGWRFIKQILYHIF